MPIDVKKLGRLLQGVGRMLEDPELAERFKAQALELTKRYGKQAALEAAAKNGATAEMLEFLKDELEKL